MLEATECLGLTTGFGLGGGGRVGAVHSFLEFIGLDMDGEEDLDWSVSDGEELEDAEVIVEVNIAGKTFQQNTRVRSQTRRMLRERRLSERR